MIIHLPVLYTVCSGFPKAAHDGMSVWPFHASLICISKPIEKNTKIDETYTDALKIPCSKSKAPQTIIIVCPKQTSTFFKVIDHPDVTRMALP